MDGKSKRLSISAIGNALCAIALLQKNIDRLPSTKACIESFVESDSDFGLKMVQWAIKNLEAEGQKIKAWKVLKKAEIKEKFTNEVEEIILKY